MKLLLDTHVLIWLVYDEKRVPGRVKAAIADAEHLFASVISGWEYEQKRAKYPDQLRLPFTEILEEVDVTPMDLPFACHVYEGRLPRLHGDPFDRMLIAHAVQAGLTLVTSDQTIRRYPLETLW